MDNKISEQLFGNQCTPAFERRGLMLDISRNRVPTMKWLKHLIDALQVLRYNELQLYTEHTCAYSAHSKVWEQASPITADEVRELDSYCSERGVELVPNQNSFGHMERWLRHDGYKHLAESPNGFEHPIAGWRDFGSTLYPSPESLEFVDTLYAELLPNFRSDKLNIGCDEPWELGQGLSRERIAKEGKHSVYLEFLGQLLSLAKRHGKQPQFWADIVLERPELVSQLPQGVTPVIWGYEADSPFPEQCQVVADAGFENSYYVAPGAGTWNSFGGRLDVARSNIENAASAGKRNLAQGLLLTAWGDNGHHQPNPTLFPSLILAAQAAWGHALCNDAQLADVIDRLFYPDEPKGNGRALCTLGHIDGTLPQPAPPSSFLHRAFFGNEDELNELVKLVSQEQLQAILEALEEVPTAQIDPEIQLGIDLDRYALERSLGIDFSKTRSSLKERFQELWLKRSRPGGLEESLGNF